MVDAVILYSTMLRQLLHQHTHPLRSHLIRTKLHTITPYLYQSICQYRYMSSITVPTIADSINEGTVASITKQVGDSVNIDDIVIILETDKVSVDIKSTATGTIEKINVKEGDTVSVGDSVIEVKDGASGEKSSKADTSSDSSATIKTNGKSSKNGKNGKKSKSNDSNDSSNKSSDSTSSQPQQQQQSQQLDQSHSEFHGRTPMIKFTHGRANEHNAQQQSSQQSG